MQHTFERLKTALADRYAIERPLGAGGMATVYRAQDLRHDRPVAVKVLHQELSATLGADRFLREIKIAARLNHPHILPVYDSGQAENLLYYVMPVERESLRDRLQRDGVVPLESALRIAQDVLDALDYAHGEGVVHRDIKPENILLSRGHAIVADFGIARAVRAAGGGQLTQTGIPIGTPAYMSPEQLEGAPDLDGRSDLYSLGCVLCEMLTGHWPPALTDLGTPSDALPPGIAPVVRRALARAPADRFATGAEFAQALATRALEPTAPTGGQGASAVPSVAVLPFVNMSADPDNEYFSDGMTEEIINALAQVKDLRVAARTSSFSFKGKSHDVAAVGTKLNVATVLEGSVRKADTKLRITAQLINVADGYHLWSERYDREMDDVFAIQDEIATRIADRLKVKLVGGPDEPLVKPPTENLEAYQLYLKGRHLWNRRNKAGLEQAVEYFEQAIAEDSSFALAYSGLADAYLLLGSYGHLTRAESHSRAKAAAEQALALDETLAEAHTSRGQVLRSERDWRGEEEEYRRAIELNPSYATAHQWYATLLCALDRMDEALGEIRRAEELDPLSHAISVTVGVILLLARDYDGAIEQLHKTLELEPHFFSAHQVLGGAYALKGRYEQAIAATERAIELNPDSPDQLGGRATIYALWGRREKALELVEEAKARGDDPSAIAGVYAQLGDADRAFEWVERAFTDAPDGLLFIKVSPLSDPVRADPRFKRLLERLGMED
jgi:serine/threonine-protein kinase